MNLRGEIMSTQSVGIREFRDKLATYLLESDGPLAITRHGDTIGYYLPRKRKTTAAEWRALDEAHARLQAEMDAAGVTEDEMIKEFERVRKEDRRKKASRR
jgi:PHD/YefM family antitoxin component YafN of YafNO toxin-antitoxin module